MFSEYHRCKLKYFSLNYFTFYCTMRGTMHHTNIIYFSVNLIKYHNFTDIKEENGVKNIIQTQTVISMILIHFRDPIIFLRTLLDESISCEDKENDIEFTLGKLINWNHFAFRTITIYMYSSQFLTVKIFIINELINHKILPLSLINRLLHPLSNNQWIMD